MSFSQGGPLLVGDIRAAIENLADSVPVSLLCLEGPDGWSIRLEYIRSSNAHLIIGLSMVDDDDLNDDSEECE